MSYPPFLLFQFSLIGFKPLETQAKVCETIDNKQYSMLGE